MIVAIVQARLGSTRLPQKVFQKLCGKPLIWHVLDRLRWSHKIDKVVLATTTNFLDDALADWAKLEGVCCYRGSEENVLSRFYYAAKETNATVVVRITADDPFKDPEIIDRVIDLLQRDGVDFAYNNHPPTFPEGLDAEVFTFSALEQAYKLSKDPFEQEHVTQYFYRHPDLFSQGNISHSEDLSHLRWTIDTPNDFKLAQYVYEELYQEGNLFKMNGILDLYKTHPELLKMNSNEKRSTMYQKNNK